VGADSMNPSGILPARVARQLRDGGFAVTVRTADGREESYGTDPAMTVVVTNDRGLAALSSLDELRVVEAYLRGDIDLVGDLVTGLDLRRMLSHTSPWLTARTFLQSRFASRKRNDPAWVEQHYDSGNMQLHAIDRDYQVYTPGLYLDDGDSLEQGAERKLAYAFHALGLRAGATVLDVGCGWGGFARYCARRGVHLTGLSLSRHQLAFARQRLAEEGLDADLRYQDFFTFTPDRGFDAISLMGSIEELADYRAVMARVDRWLNPGGLVYLDFAAVDRAFGVASFVTRYVWPGAFRMVHMPSFVRAVTAVEFDIVDIRNDRRNYHLWAKHGYERWMRDRDAILADVDERTWRLMRVLCAGTSHLMSEHSTWATAYRVVLERRAAPAHGGASARMYDRPTMSATAAGAAPAVAAQ
jgi:cyclopropane-fatty-acyl-phospholipid synthase